MITKRLSGECYKITDHLFLGLTLSGEYGNISFFYIRDTQFSVPKLKEELNESSPKWANCLQTDEKILDGHALKYSQLRKLF